MRQRHDRVRLYWEHHFEIVEHFDAPIGSRLPIFVEGQRRTPPEDVGGPPGFEMFLEAITDPNHEEYQNLIEWNDGPYEPTNIEEYIVKIQMSRLAHMRQPRK